MKENPPTAAETNQAASLITEGASQGSSKPIMLVLGIVFVIIVGLVGFILYTRASAKKTPTLSQVIPTATPIPVSPTPTVMPTPVISPVTTTNEDQTLSNTDTAIQQSMNQVNTDLNSLNSVDSSQDSTSGIQ